MTDKNAPPPLADHIEETVRSIAQLQAEHRQNATTLQRAIDGTTGLLSRPWFIVILLLTALGWIGVNLVVASLGYHSIDPPPFTWLSGAASLASLFMVVLILATQRQEDQLGRRRELLILELAILSEQKTAKVIELLEEVRRDNPLIQDRVDKEAEAMAQPADPKSVLEVIQETHSEAEQTGAKAVGK